MAKTNTSSKQPYTGDTANETDVAAVLLNVLRNVNAQSKTAVDLQGNAKSAVEHFQAISRDLRTLADSPPSAPALPT